MYDITIQMFKAKKSIDNLGVNALDKKTSIVSAKLESIIIWPSGKIRKNIAIDKHSWYVICGDKMWATKCCYNIYNLL